MAKRKAAHDDLWAQHDAVYRDPHQVVAQWALAARVDTELLDGHARGDFWGALDEAGLTLLLTREYEHLAMALSVVQGQPRISYMHVPHPNGLAVDRRRRVMYLASTRNPNMVYELVRWERFAGAAATPDTPGVLVPRAARFLPGRLYLHDLALIGTTLFATATGTNAVVKLPRTSGFEPAWWPRCIERPSGPRFDANYLQLNAIAAGTSLEESYFCASASAPGRHRPGTPGFPVDGRGVVFSGRTREVCARGLTRPHSLRFHRRELWVQNSGYGQLGRIAGARFEPAFALPGWTRGLCFHGDLAFAGTSRVLPRFRHYAPGVDETGAECGVHVLDLKSGAVRGSLCWPRGNQIFGIEALPRSWAIGFPLVHPPALSPQDTAALFFGQRPDRR